MCSFALALPAVRPIPLFHTENMSVCTCPSPGAPVCLSLSVVGPTALPSVTRMLSGCAVQLTATSPMGILKTHSVAGVTEEPDFKKCVWF